MPDTRDDLTQRIEIREALIDLCLERGYREIDLELLLARARVDLSAFERHYTDLEDCFCLTFAEIRDWANARVGRAADRHRSWLDRMRAAAYALLRALNSDQRTTHLAMVDARFAGDRALLLMAEGMEEMFTLIDEGRRDGRSSGRISRATAESIGGSILNQVFVAVAREFPLPETMVPQLMYVAVLPYLGPEAAEAELIAPADPGPPDEPRFGATS